jgi:signal transduction histidine kinase
MGEPFPRDRSTVHAVLELAALDKRDWDRTLEWVLRVDSQVLEVERTNFWTLYDHPKRIVCELGFIRSGATLERGAVLLRSDAASYIDVLGSERVIDIEDAATDPRTVDLRDYCAERHVRALLDVPVWADSKLVGVLCHEQVDHTRRWQPEEIDFALFVAQTIATALEARGRAKAEEQTRRASFLSDASLQLGGSLDEHQVSGRAVEVAARTLGDWAVIHCFTDGRVVRMAAFHKDPAKRELLEELARRYPPNPQAPQLVAQAHRFKQGIVVPEVTDQLMRNNGMHEGLIAGLRVVGSKSALVVPLSAGAIDAVLIVVSGERSYHAQDLQLLEEFAYRVALALDNARLYRESQQARRERDEFVALAAHELKTPLTALRLTTEGLMASRSGAPNHVATAYTRIDGQCRRLSRLANRLLVACQAEPYTPDLRSRTTDLVPLVRDVIEDLEPPGERAGIERELPDSLLGYCDADQLQLVVAILLDNAMKYGGKRPVRVRLGTDGGYVELSVADAGGGIDPELMPRLFGRYQRGASARVHGGLGLGLFVAQRIMAAHGGSLEVRNGRSSGTEFVLRLPAATGDGVRAHA